MEKQEITYKEIAELAEVSVGTVSRYFNDYNISEKAKEKIKKVIEEVNYIPNYSASMVKKENKDVYIILPFNKNQNSNFAIINGCEQELEKTGHNLFILMSSEDEDKYLIDFEKIIFRQPAGIILLFPKKTEKYFIEEIAKYKDKNIIIYNRPDVVKVGLKTISLNDNKMFYDFTKSINEDTINNKIAYIGLKDSDATTGLARKKGFLKFVNENNIEHFVEQVDSEIKSLRPEVIEYIYKNEYKSIVCGTHKIFLTVMKEMHNKNKFKDYIITDVGNYSEDFSILKPKSCLLVDYSLVGEDLAKVLISGKMENRNKKYYQIKK